MAKSRRGKVFLLTMMVLMVVVTPVMAAQGDRITLAPGQMVNDDFYAAGRSVSIQGIVGGDLMTAGETISSEGRTGGDVLAAGRYLNLDGDVGGDVRAAGQVIEINAQVERAVTILGQQLSIRNSAKVGRNLIFFGENLELDGTVGGNVRAGVNTATVAGRVGGNLKIDADRLEVLPGARIDGDLIMRGPEPPQIAPGAEVKGQVKYTAVAPEAPANRPWWQVLGQKLLSLLKLLALALLLVFVGTPFLRSEVETLTQKPWSSLGVGLGWTVLAPMAIILLAITVVGQSAAWLLGVAYGAFIFIGGLLFKPVLGALLCSWLQSRFGGGRKFSLAAQTLVGATILWLICLIPVAGTVITVLGVMITLGSGLILLGRYLLVWPRRRPA